MLDSRFRGNDGITIYRDTLNTLGPSKIHAFIASINPASGRVLEKLGMLREGHRPAHIRKADQYYDTDDYGMLRRDYKNP